MKPCTCLMNSPVNPNTISILYRAGHLYESVLSVSKVNIVPKWFRRYFRYTGYKASNLLEKRSRNDQRKRPAETTEQKLMDGVNQALPLLRKCGSRWVVGSGLRNDEAGKKGKV